ncbi:protocadherin Fat 4 [Aplysia californica]|uniref:Protocadherin Fat 4 n=1 Tax=Aplysia californica TaxID=6500 RepID=A0ABM1VPQ9_APLCA|nr:protocadherin Fat 4 [Aplysia californica]
MVRYSLLDNGSDLFSVDSRTGLVLTKAVLDHETRASVTLTVKAVVGGRSSTVKVDVNILDVNDEGPMFSPANYKFTVLEDTPVGSFIGQVNAIDKDSGSNGVVKYTLLDTGSSHQFSVESITGQISTMAALDREVQGSVTLTVSAADLGSNSRSATAVVNIDIVDVNDNAPMFTAVKYMFQVSDPAPVGFIIGTVSAIDGDMGDNGMVTYSLRNGTDQFDINAHTGQITLVSALTSADVTFIVRATDNGDPALSSDAQVLVKSSDAVLLG